MPYITTLRLLQSVISHHGDRFQWKAPPYEYEFERQPIDLIIGDPAIRRRVENLDDIDQIEKSWSEDLKTFTEASKRFHLYT